MFVEITEVIVNENEIIVTENLKVKNHNIAKVLTDVSLYEIVEQLT